MSDQKDLDPTQTIELARLLDLEARWENLTKTPESAVHRAAMLELHRKQNAHQEYQAKLISYQKRYKGTYPIPPVHSTPGSIRTWCRKMCALFCRVKDDTQAVCPTHLIEKAYRVAGVMAHRLGVEPLVRISPPVDIAAAIRDLEAIARWCADLVDGSVKDGFAELAREDPPASQPAGAPHILHVHPPDAADRLPDVPGDPQKADHPTVDLGPAVA